MVTESPIWTPARHPLARLLRETAAGSSPNADGEWIRVSPWSQSTQAILSVSNHVVLAVSYDVTDAQLTDLGVDGIGGAFGPRVLTALAGPAGWIGSLDVLLLSAGRGAQAGEEPLVSRPDLGRTPRAEHARRVSQDVQVMGHAGGDSTDLIVLSRGVAGVRQIDVHVASGSERGPGAALDLIERGLHCVPEDELVAASVPPGDAAALRVFLDSGFRPVGAVQLFSNRPERRA